MNNTIKLLPEAVLQIPFEKYEKDFTFFVNSEKFETSSFAADLLSPLISSRHLVDPTLNEFTINTKKRGNFNNIIKLINFDTQFIEFEDIPFILEVFDQLSIEKVETKIKIESDPNYEINNDNIFELIAQHQSLSLFFKDELKQEIEYFASHLFELKEKFIQNIKNDENEFNEEILDQILNNRHIVIEREDDILDIVNELYLKDDKYSKFYEFVDFRNVEVRSMKEFIENFNLADINIDIWRMICFRLECEINQENHKSKRSTLHQIKVKCSADIPNKTNEFDGIFNYFRTHSNIKDEVDISVSSSSTICDDNDPFNLIQYNDMDIYFSTKNYLNSWIVFEFKNHTVIPTSYTIRSRNIENSNHLKSWKIQGSNDKRNWITLDEHKNNDLLNGASRVHSFNLLDEKENQQFEYLKIEQTGPSWYDNDDTHFQLTMNSIEFYGKII